MRDAVTTARFPSAFLPEGLTMGVDDATQWIAAVA